MAAFGATSVQGSSTGPDISIEEDPDGGTVITVQKFGAPAIRRGPQESDDFGENLAERLNEFELSLLAERTFEGIENDQQARRDWEQTAARGIELLGIKLEDAVNQVSISGTVSRVHDTALIDAVVTHWANANAELLPAGGPVKVRDDEPMTSQGNPGVKRDELADALEKDFNHYVTVTDRPWRADFSRMLVSRALMGVEFREVYRDPILRRPVSRWVNCLDLIVSPDATDLTDAARVTKRLFIRQANAKRMIACGQWRDINLAQPNEMVPEFEQRIAQIVGVNPRPMLPPDHRHEIFETYEELDNGELLADETGREPGYPLPYRVTMDKDSRRIVEIRRNWKKGDPDHRARRRFVKYGMIPGFWGIYDIGFVHLVGNPQRALTAMERLGIDASMFASFPGGFIAKGPGSRTDTVEARVAPGQLKVIDTGGKKLSDIIEMNPYHGPDATLLAMRSAVKDDVRRLTGSVQMPVGEGRVGDVPATTMLAYVDTVQKVPSAVHKDDHAAQADEFGMLLELFVEDPSALWKDAKNPARKWQVAQELADQELIPAADPNTPSQPHRILTASALVQLAMVPQMQGIFNMREVATNAIRTLGQDPTRFIAPAPPPGAQPPPDPRAIAQQAQAQAAMAKISAQQQETALEHQGRMQELAAESADKAADRESRAELARLKLVGDAMKTHQAGQQHATQLAQDNVHHARDTAVDLLGLHQQGQQAAQQTPPAPPIGIAQPEGTAP